MLLLFTTWPNRNIFLASETKRQEKKNNHHKNFIHIFSHSLFDPSNNLLFLAQTKLKSSFENRWGIEKLNIRQMASSCRGKKKQHKNIYIYKRIRNMEAILYFHTITNFICIHRGNPVRDIHDISKSAIKIPYDRPTGQTKINMLRKIAFSWKCTNYSVNQHNTIIC